MSVSVSDQIGPGSVDQTYYQGRHLGENWGDDRKAIFIQQGKKKGLTPPKNEKKKPTRHVLMILSHL